MKIHTADLAFDIHIPGLHTMRSASNITTEKHAVEMSVGEESGVEPTSLVVKVKGEVVVIVPATAQKALYPFRNAHKKDAEAKQTTAQQSGQKK
jgi:hypothetical protein